MVLMVDGYANDGGTNDFRLECECEARRPDFSPPATDLVGESSQDTPMARMFFSMIVFRISRALFEVIDIV
jgi:hypothetical protein